MEMNVITIALPTGKNLEEQTIALLKDAGIVIGREHPRSYTATISGLPGLYEWSARFFKPPQIPSLVCAGPLSDAVVGITGADALRESPAEVQERVEIYAELPYSSKTAGSTRCVLFVRNDDRIRDAQDIAQGRGATVAAEYPLETTEWFKRRGVDVNIEAYTGSVEALVVDRRARFGVALTETGETLRVNGLREIAEIFRSSTVLLASRWLDNSTADVVRFLARLLKGTLEARDKVLLLMNAPRDEIDNVVAMLPSLRSPTVTPLADSGYCSISSVVERGNVNHLIFHLSLRGAEGFIVQNISTVM